MFYIEKDVPMMTALAVRNFTFHALTQVRIDYINKEIEINLGSYSSFDELQNGVVSLINAYIFNYERFDKNKPLDLEVLSLLTSLYGVVFEGCEVKEYKDKNETVENNFR